MNNNLKLEWNGQVALHPGLYITDILTELEITQKELAKRADIPLETISQLVNGEVPLSPAMAIKLSKVSDLSPIIWLNIQTKYDILEKMSQQIFMLTQSIVLDQLALRAFIYSGLL